MPKPLPKGILKSDLQWSKNWKLRAQNPVTGISLQFEIWYVEGNNNFGWCIPTLGITKRSSSFRNPSFSGGVRTYAVTVNNGRTVRIGNGPHVKERHTIYVKKSRLKALQKFLDLQNGGAEEANNIRDRISTRRAQGSLHRASWGF